MGFQQIIDNCDGQEIMKAWYNLDEEIRDFVILAEKYGYNKTLEDIMCSNCPVKKE